MADPQDPRRHTEPDAGADERSTADEAAERIGAHPVGTAAGVAGGAAAGAVGGLAAGPIGSLAGAVLGGLAGAAAAGAGGGAPAGSPSVKPPGGASVQPEPGSGAASAESAAQERRPESPLDDPQASTQDVAPRGVPPRPGG